MQAPFMTLLVLLLLGTTAFGAIHYTSDRSCPLPLVGRYRLNATVDVSGLGRTTITVADPLDRVFYNDPVPESAAMSVIPVTAAADEVVQFQIVLNGAKSGSPIVANAPLVSGTGDLAESGSSPATIRKAWNTNVTYPVNAEKRGGLYPDPLVDQVHEGNTWPMTAGENLILWVSFRMPSTGFPIGGVSVGGVQVNISDCAYRFAVPNATEAWMKTDTSSGNKHAWGSDRHNTLDIAVTENDAAFEAWMQNYADHRVNRGAWQPSIPGMGPYVTFDINGSNLQLHTAQFEKRILAMRKMGFRSGLRMPRPYGYFGVQGCQHVCVSDVQWWFTSATPTQRFHGRKYSIFANPPSEEDRLRGTNLNFTFDPLFEKIFRGTYEAQISYLESKGWLGMFEWGMFVDEPDYQDPWTFGIVLHLGRFFKSLHPSLKLAQTKFPIPTIPELMPQVDMWIAHINQVSTPGALETMASIKKKFGCDLVIYHNGIPILDVPLHRIRLFPWQIWRSNWAVNNTADRFFGLHGSLSWYNDAGWTGQKGWPDPYESANQDPKCITEHCPYNAAGWGMLIYPPVDFNMTKPPVSSIRWEIFMLGLQDSEYFAMLAARVVAFEAPCQKNTTAAVGATPACCAAVTAGTAALDGTSKAIWDFPTIKQFNPPLPFVNDTTIVQEAKHAVALALEAINDACPK